MTPAEREARRVADLRAIMETEPGRRFVWWLLERTGQYQSSMTGDQWTAYNEGRRSLGIALSGELAAHCLDDFLRMQADGYADLREQRGPVDKEQRAGYDSAASQSAPNLWSPPSE